MVQCAISLGGNLGDVPARFSHALGLLEASGAVSDVRRSRDYRTAPMGFAAGEPFHNAAAVFETNLAPLDVLDLLQDIEQRCGRVRTVHWGPRTLDLDLLRYGEQIVDSPRLMVPHPGLWYRRFVLDPLVELIPDVVHPVFQQSIREVRHRLVERPFLPICLCGISLQHFSDKLLPAQFASRIWPINSANPKIMERLAHESAAASYSAIVFATFDAESNWPHVIRLPNDETAAAQLVNDVLTAALDEPMPV